MAADAKPGASQNRTPVSAAEAGRRPGPRRSTSHSIGAVLPVANLRSDNAQDLLVEGVVDDIKHGAVRGSAHSSSRQFQFHRTRASVVGRAARFERESGVS